MRGNGLSPISEIAALQGGRLVIGSDIPLTIGSQIRYGGEVFAVRILEQASESDFERQVELGAWPGCEFAEYFYWCEAMD